MTYPSVPTLNRRGSISDLDITTEQTSATTARSLSPVTDAVRDPSGAAGLGYLVAPGRREHRDGRVVRVPSGLDRHRRPHAARVDAAVQGPAILESHLTRAGSRLIVVGVDIYDGDGLADLDELTDPIDTASVATGLVTFAGCRRRRRPRRGVRSARRHRQRRHMEPDGRGRRRRCSSGSG